MSGGFQTAVNVMPAPGIAGDFSDTNPRFSYDAGPGGLVAGPNGLNVGAFAWVSNSSIDLDNAGSIANNYGTGNVTGFVHREQQANILIYLADESLTIPPGMPATIMTGGGFWVLNSGTTQALPGQKAYANFANGLATFAATGSPATATSTSYTIAAGTSSFTGSIAGNVMTVTGTVTGTIYPGTAISGTSVATGTRIVSQLPGGTVGGVGTYVVSIPEQTVAATTISGTYGLFTAGGTITGVFGLNQTLSGTGVSAGTTITALGTGAGGAGTYIVNITQTASTGTITAATNVETKWIAKSAGLAGEVVKISEIS